MKAGEPITQYQIIQLERLNKGIGASDLYSKISSKINLLDGPIAPENLHSLMVNALQELLSKYNYSGS
jgi:hypothetical protein